MSDVVDTRDQKRAFFFSLVNDVVCKKGGGGRACFLGTLFIAGEGNKEKKENPSEARKGSRDSV